MWKFQKFVPMKRYIIHIQRVSIILIGAAQPGEWALRLQPRASDTAGLQRDLNVCI